MLSSLQAVLFKLYGNSLGVFAHVALSLLFLNFFWAQAVVAQSSCAKKMEDVTRFRVFVKGRWTEFNSLTCPPGVETQSKCDKICKLLNVE